jgi:2-dehydro-3-deoxygluconokinase
LSNKKVVGFGEVMLRLGAPAHQRIVQVRQFDAMYTGAEANVLVSLENFGVSTFLVSKVPDTEVGQACINYIRSFGVDTGYVSRGGERLATFYLETGASQRPSKVIYDRAYSAFSQMQPGEVDWDAVFAGKDWFHFCGTAPALGSNTAAVTAEACAAAKRLGLTVSCDANFRRKLWTPEKAREVMSALMENVDVLICNEEDAEMSFDIKAEGVDVSSGKIESEKYHDVARQLADRFALSHVGITLRESISASVNGWSAVLFDGESYFQSRRYEIQIVDRVGGGDSFTGGLIFGLLNDMGGQDTIEFASAASCLKQTIHGDLNMVSKEEVLALAGGEASGRVQR